MVYGKICIGTQSRCFAQRIAAGRTCPVEGGDNKMTLKDFLCFIAIASIVLDVIAFVITYLIQ